MKLLVIASFSFLLAACTASETSTDAAAQPSRSVAKDAISEAPTSEASAPKRAPGEENVDLLQAFRALGTEPFWNVRVEGNQLTFATPENQDGTLMHGERAAAVGGGVDIKGNNNGRPFSLSVRPGTCSDGMSDHVYEMSSTFSHGDVRYSGCAEAAK